MCQREQLNNFFTNISHMKIAVWAIFKQLYFVTLAGVGVELEKSLFILFNLHSKTRVL